MKFRILGAGWYGCAIAEQLLEHGHEATVFERAADIFAGASGGNPARLHQGAHYPRSRATREQCQEHHHAFMNRYGELTHGVPVNLYAIAAHDSLVDFPNYLQTMRREIDLIEVERPAEFGLVNVEGAILTGERHIVVDAARAHFKRTLADHLVLGCQPNGVENIAGYDWTVDCTFCAMDAAGIDRFEPCVTALLRGPTDTAVTIMDGPFPSLYPWNEVLGLCSLTSASLTPLARCTSRREAEQLAAECSAVTAQERAAAMIEQMAHFYPLVATYELERVLVSIRALPRSGADSRLIHLVRVGERSVRIRAGKIDAVLAAYAQLIELCSQ